MFSSDQWYAKVDSADFYSYKINQSLRFDDDSNTYLNRTPGSTTNQRTWTYSFWFKHGSRTSIFDFLLANSSGDKFFEFSLTGAQKFQIYYHDETLLVSSAVFRDRSAWYHIVLRHDTTQSTADHRLRIYVNGSELTAWDTNGRANLPQDFDGGINEASVSHIIGQNQISNNDLDGYMAEVHLIDGSSLAPTSFGELKDEIWIPAEYAGSHGTNGFYLPFDDASAIGDDESSNTNDWTANNFSGANDIVPDTPTNNFATFNPLNSPAAAVLSEGNLKFTQTSNDRAAIGNMAMASGKWYFEVYYTAGSNPEAGLARIQDSFANSGATGSSDKFLYITNATSFRTPAWTATDNTGVSAQTSETILGFAVDADNGKAFISVNGTYINSGDPAAGSNPQATFDADWVTQTGGGVVPFIGVYTGTSADIRINFGQDSSFAGAKTAQGNQDANSVGDFYYSPPSGGANFLALCSQNLDTPAIIDGTDYFETLTYGGSGSSQGVTGLSFSPAWVWIKNKGRAGQGHVLHDTVRGNDGAEALLLQTDSTAAETHYDNFGVTTFDSGGFTVIGNGGLTNLSGDTYVAWNWLAATAFSNDASATSVGTIDSSGRANTTAGFSIVSYTGTGSAGTIKHGLSAAPEMLIVKNRDTARDWVVYHSALGATKRIWLNYTYAEDSGTAASATWNDTAPTSSVFSVGTNIHSNESGDDFICYAFHSVEGYSKVGSYVGNGNSDGPFIYTGFRPAWIMIKNATDAGEHWEIWDNTRDTYNVLTKRLRASSTGAEVSSTFMDFVSNGVKHRNTSGGYNASGKTFIYLAFAEQPFKFSNAR